MQNPDEKKTFVKEKFSSISHKYDFLNSLLSFQIDRYWRWVTTRELKMFPTGAVLDLCAGTLPLSLELTRQAPGRQVVAIDFCEDMLRAGIKTLPRDGRRARIFPVCGDGEKIPARDASFWGITVAYFMGDNAYGTATRRCSNSRRGSASGRASPTCASATTACRATTSR